MGDYSAHRASKGMRLFLETAHGIILSADTSATHRNYASPSSLHKPAFIVIVLAKNCAIRCSQSMRFSPNLENFRHPSSARLLMHIRS
jgi:hypothetical protein